MLVIAAALSLLFSLVSFVRPVAATQGDKATICHATHSETNPYVIITVAYSAVDSDGNNDHMHHTGPVWYAGAKADGVDWGDIIPPIDGVTPGLNWTTEGAAIWENGCKAGGGDAQCIPASDFTDTELRDLLLGEGSNVDDPQIANGSTATTWDATVIVPDELCDVEVTYASYQLPGGFMEPYDEQVLFDYITGTYAGGSTTPLTIGLPDCGWQVDLYIGPVITDLDADFGAPDHLVIDWAANEGVPCDEEEEESGTLEIRKTTTPTNSTESFAFTATYGAAEGFALSNGGVLAATELAVGDYSVSEVLTAAQTTAGWSLSSITCTEGAEVDVDLATDTVTVTIADGDAIVCTFANTLASGGTLPNNPPRGGTAGGNPPLPNTAMLPQLTGSLPAALVALLMVAGLGAGAWVTTAEARRRR